MSDEEWEVEHKKEDAVQASLDKLDHEGAWLEELEAELQKLPPLEKEPKSKVLVIQVPTSPKVEKEETPEELRQRIAQKIRELMTAGRVRRKEDLWNLMAEEGFDATLREVIGSYAQLLEAETTIAPTPERIEAPAFRGYAAAVASGYGSWSGETAREKADVAELTRQTGAVAPNPVATGAADIDAVKTVRKMTGDGVYREDFSLKKAEERPAYMGWG